MGRPCCREKTLKRYNVYWRRKHKEQTNISWLIAGAVGFIVSARVLELGEHYVCIIANNTVSRFINGNTAVSFDYAMMAMNVIERLPAMSLHIGLTVIVYYGVINGKKTCLPLAILLHMLTDTFPALYQRGLVQLWTVEIWAALWTAVIGFIAVKLYRRMGVSQQSVQCSPT